MGMGTKSTMGIRNADASVLRPVNRVFFLSLHHTTNGFENNSIFFIFPLQISNQNTSS
jgi:hypothetical protein